MKPIRQSKNDGIFSGNNQSENIHMVTCENGRRVNIKIFEKNKNRKQSTKEKKDVKLKKRRSSLPYNAYTKLDIRYMRQQRYSIALESEKSFLTEGKTKVARELILQRFRDFINKIQLLMKIFKRIFMYAMEKGEHEKITSDPRLRLKGHQAGVNPDKEMLFDPERFKTDFQGFFPKWAKCITCKMPEERTEQEIDSLMRLLKQLKQFRRYTQEVQRLMCRVVRYDRFERHRVIIRKGHVGRCFYIIYSGTVCFTLSEDDQKVLANTSGTEYYNLNKGDSFGELALLRGVRRAATIVCLQQTEFLSVEKDEFQKMGIVDCLQGEMEYRVSYFRGLDLFSTWPAELLRKVAEECQLLEFRNDVVIDRNLMMSDLVHVVTKGKCHILRLLDLTNSKKWVKRRRHQSKLYSSVFPDNVSSPCSRQGTCSRLSTFSNATSFNDQKINRLRSDPQLPRKIARPEYFHHPQRMVKSAFTRTVKKAHDLSHTKQVMQPVSGRHNSAYSKTDSEPSKFGAGVFLRLDVIEKGEIAGLQRIVRTDEDVPFKSNTDTRRFFLVSKGCEIISLPVEVLKKHCDLETLKKVEKEIKEYPKDEELLDCYLENSDWNTYKEVLLGTMVKEIEKRKSSGKPGTALRTHTRYEERERSTISRLETRETYEEDKIIFKLLHKKDKPGRCLALYQLGGERKERSEKQKASNIVELLEDESRMIKEGRRSSSLRRQQSPDQDPSKFTRSLCSPSPARSMSQSFCYPYKPSKMIYAKGSHRNLVLVNGGIGTN